jgi:hypothetical protein
VAEPLNFEFRRPVWRHRLLALTIPGSISVVMLIVGVKLYPGNIRPFWGFLSAFLIFGGVVGSIHQLVALLGYGNPNGAWRISLNSERFEWTAPRHLWRREASFALKRADIETIVRVTFPNDDQLRADEFWLCPHGGKPVRLRDHSGVSLATIFNVATNLGVPTETRTDSL